MQRLLESWDDIEKIAALVAGGEMYELPISGKIRQLKCENTLNLRVHSLRFEHILSLSGIESGLLGTRVWLYIDCVHFNIWSRSMALQIANPVVVAKVERLARAMGLTKTAVVERAIDRLANEAVGASGSGRMSAILEQIDRIPDRPDAFDPLEWDLNGLPK